MAHIEAFYEPAKKGKMSEAFCVLCGASMEGVPADWMTCRNKDCIRKLGLFCDDVTDRSMALCYPDAEPERATHRREFREKVWQRIARPVTAPDQSVRGIGNKKAAGVLPSLLLDDGTIPPELDGDMYGRLVANGWVDFSAYVYRALLAKEAKPST